MEIDRLSTKGLDKIVPCDQYSKVYVRSRTSGSVSGVPKRYETEVLIELELMKKQPPSIARKKKKNCG